MQYKSLDEESVSEGNKVINLVEIWQDSVK